MKSPIVIAVPQFAASLLAAVLLPIVCQSSTAQTPLVKTPVAAAPVIADAVRVFPRAGFASRMVGGEIQGSNESATGGFVTLAKITQAPREGQWTRIALKNTKSYRFLRYFGPTGSYTNLAEIEFLSANKKIEGQPYGTFGSRDNSGNDYNKAFDGDTRSFFDAVAPNSQYLGIEIKRAETSSAPATPVVVGKGLRSFHIGNSLTDGMGEYTRQLAIAAGYTDHWMDRQTIPGSPLYLNYQSDGGFGTNYRKAFVDYAPISDLLMQTFISNGDSEDPEFSLKFYDAAREKSPNIRPWIYGQWDVTGSGGLNSGSADWEERNIKLMRIYMAHASNFNGATKGKKAEVVPSALALINLKRAFDAGKVPGLTNFFSTNYSDDLHLTEAGRQFIGMVIFASLYNQSPVGLPIVKINDNAPALTPEQNKVYQQVAWDTVQSFRKDGGASLGLAIPAEIDARVHAFSSIPIRGSRLNYIGEKSSFTYVLNAPQAGRYDLKVSAYADRPDEKLQVFVNSTSVGELTVKKDEKQPLSDTAALPIDLKAGSNVLRLYVPTNRPYDLNSIKITRAGQEIKNTMPIFDLNVWDEEIKPGESFTRDFNLSDFQTPSEQIKVTATSDNTRFVPNANIKVESGEFKGSGAISPTGA
jgi:hypothetical protein